jgi:hypothetical protein
MADGGERLIMGAVAPLPDKVWEPLMYFGDHLLLS